MSIFLASQRLVYSIYQSHVSVFGLILCDRLIAKQGVEGFKDDTGL